VHPNVNYGEPRVTSTHNLSQYRCFALFDGEF
jgi:hypothetical protein